MPEERTVKEVFRNIPQGKGPLESQETDGWTMLKMISRNWGVNTLRTGDADLRVYFTKVQDG
jgi:hypothetical protein